jgi:hypothetical protein
MSIICTHTNYRYDCCDKIKEYRDGLTCGMHGETVNACTILVGKSERMHHMGDLGDKAG